MLGFYSIKLKRLKSLYFKNSIFSFYNAGKINTAKNINNYE